MKLSKDFDAGLDASRARGARAATEDTEGGIQITGDSNQDGRLDLSDALHLLRYLFLHGAQRLPCGNGGAEEVPNITLLNFDRDLLIGPSDGLAILNYFFLGGPAPERGLSCARISGCPDICVRK